MVRGQDPPERYAVTCEQADEDSRSDQAHAFPKNQFQNAGLLGAERHAHGDLVSLGQSTIGPRSLRRSEPHRPTGPAHCAVRTSLAESHRPWIMRISSVSRNFSWQARIPASSECVAQGAITWSPCEGEYPGIERMSTAEFHLRNFI
jgi:hypothetical protein